MTSLLKRSALRLLPGLLLATAAFAQTGAMEGTVKGPDGLPAKDVLVKIERTDIKGNYKVKTKKKGDYFHAGLPIGTYRVTVEFDGKDADTVNGIRVGLGDPTKVDFDLEAMAKRAQAMQKAAEAGQMPTAEQARDMTPEQKAALEKAMKERTEAMKKNKELQDAFNGGMTALQAKDYPTAITQFTKASEMDPKQHVIWGNLADAHAQAANGKTGAEYDAAMNSSMQAYQKALELVPTDASYHNNYALALAKTKKFDEAQAELDKAAQLDAANAGKYYYNLGALLTNNGQLEPAGAAFKKALEADPNYADAHYQYGIYLISKAKVDASGKMTPEPGTKEAFEAYLGIKPDGPFAPAAKEMLTSLGATIQQKYENPAAKKATPARKK